MHACRADRSHCPCCASVLRPALCCLVSCPLQQGNRHFQAQEYKQAAAAYSQALSLGVDDAALAAVLLCNRAASQHAAGQYLDAIADCCLAHQLDPKYPRSLQVCGLHGGGLLRGWLAAACKKCGWGWRQRIVSLVLLGVPTCCVLDLSPAVSSDTSAPGVHLSSTQHALCSGTVVCVQSNKAVACGLRFCWCACFCCVAVCSGVLRRTWLSNTMAQQWQTCRSCWSRQQWAAARRWPCGWPVRRPSSAATAVWGPTTTLSLGCSRAPRQQRSRPHTSEQWGAAWDD